jgi:ssDNA-binding Zn-finger/Zn-ribbon topoisomerase 1
MRASGASRHEEGRVMRVYYDTDADRNLIGSKRVALSSENRTTGERLVGCTGYPRCRSTKDLPG